MLEAILIGLMTAYYLSKCEDYRRKNNLFWARVSAAFAVAWPLYYVYVMT